MYSSIRFTPRSCTAFACEEGRNLRNNRKKLYACLTAAMLLIQTSAMNLPVLADTEPDTAESQSDTASAGGTANPEAVEWVTRSEADVLAKMRIAAENDNLAFYVWDNEKLADDEKAEDVFALKNKKNGYIWWSSPINAGGDKIASKVLCKELQSTLVLSAAEPDNRSSSFARSGDTSKCTVIVKDVKNGVQVTYNFKKAGIKIPVTYTLCEDYLGVTINSEDITEKYGVESEDEDKFIITHSLAVLNAFGAADSKEEGCFVIPDGSGAVINFNNRKYTAKTYSQLIYDVDTTAVPKTKGPVVEGVSLPMYGICKGENAMLAVAAGGDGNCTLNADVSGKGQSNTEYNRCFFRFNLRSQDTYYLGGDSLNPLDVYEKNMEHTKIDVRYYPLCAADAINEDNSENLDYVDIAARYRQYLTEDMGVQPKAKANDAALYLDIYCGCEKQKNILGFPVFMKTAMTNFDEAQDIVKAVQAAGADDLVVSLNHWTSAGISGKVDYKAKPAATLGGKSDFKKLTSYLDESGIAWYPIVSNTAFYSGNGYSSFTDTAVRVSGSFARIVDYERAYGVPYGEKKTMSLLSPSTFSELYAKLAENYQKAGLKSVGIGAMSSTLYGDYGKKSASSREQTKTVITESLQKLQSDVGSVLSADPNAYVLPCTDRITDMPLYSSGFNLFDGDIPLYQLVMHGLIPYATKAVNGSADAKRLVMLAAATGSNLHFDLLHAEISELKDTDYDVYYYAYHDYWTQNAAQYHAFIKDVVAAVSDSHIISYQADGDKITTKYANGTETLVNLTDCSVTMNGKTRFLKDYLKEGEDVLGSENKG